MSLTIAENFIYFHKGEFPCFFMVEVAEGFARFDIKDQHSLEIIISFCGQKKYHVSWARAVANDAANRKAFRKYPGGKYVASSKPTELEN